MHESLMELLPDELLEHVLLLLPDRDVVAIGACCSRLRCVAFSDGIWRRRYEQQFPHSRTSSGGLSWRDVYARAMRCTWPGVVWKRALATWIDTRLGFRGVKPERMAFDHERQRIIGWVKGRRILAWQRGQLRVVGLWHGARQEDVELLGGAGSRR
eukprot:TRINITY_DN6837_c0_g2_i2.p2 TRINITY_DN6837_c0_g2~~TRINITY_DN6837_c0_g2_i2.p2  ORF type:complete len:156 (-),score=22.84 TRINITY_DN6837_c0_g2_i2:556-1023(-)